ncbi:MAG: HNH endonuclease [Proteobacteria bacterium]|nr:MAG: HNH endonuclease [Pseudomonadota bacterium]
MSELKLVSDKANSYWAIHDRAMMAASNLKRSEIEMLDALIDVESRQVYYQMEIKDLFQYCTEMLGLSRHASYNFITVMNKSKEVPALLEAIRDGSTTVSKARKICSVITGKNAKEWIGLTRECSSRIVERAVAMANPRAAIHESMKYVSADVLELKFAVSEEWSELLNDVKDLMSQKKQRAVSTEETLFLLMSEFKQKHDPVLKAERAKAKHVGRKAELAHADTKSTNTIAHAAEPTSAVAPDTRYIPAASRHKIALRDSGKCTFVDRHGKRCGSGRWIQKHHVHHFVDGGSHEPENLETLCWAHHVMKHRR